MTVSQISVSEIPLSNTALTAFTEQASADSVVVGQRVGYVRVSTVAQTLNQQDAVLEAAGVRKTFSGITSGARHDRPSLAAQMEYVREGDTVVVWKLERLGCNYRAHP